MNYQEVFTKIIKSSKDAHLYRYFTTLTKSVNNFPNARMKNCDVNVWCSNDYLGLSMHPKVIDAFTNCAMKNGVGSGGTRNISGDSSQINILERKIAKFHNKDSGLVFTSGYVSNIGAISAIVKMIPDIHIFSDEKNHASIISGIKISRARKDIFLHNDINNLRELLKNSTAEAKMIIIEGVYSMDGSTANLPEIVSLAKEYNALIYIDEVHATGLYGHTRGGIAQYYNLENEIDIIQGTFGKSFGVIGGYITGNAEIIDAIRLNSSDFIFTTSLPPAICSAICASLDIILSDEGSNLQKKHFENVSIIKSMLLENEIEFLQNDKVDTHIIPIMVNDANRARLVCEELLKLGIYIQSINYPTVKIGTERLRLTCNPYHTDKMIKELVSALKYVLKNKS